MLQAHDWTISAGRDWEAMQDDEEAVSECFLCDEEFHDSRLTILRIGGTFRLVCLDCYKRIQAEKSKHLFDLAAQISRGGRE